MKIEKYKNQSKEAILSLLYPKESDSFEKKSRIWNWQYFENPYVDDDSRGLVVNETDMILGYNGLMPVKLKYNSEIIDASWSCDTILSPLCRGKGYGKKLFASVTESFPIMLGLGISDAATHILSNLNWRANDEIEQYFYFNRPGTIKDLIKMVIQISNRLINISSSKKKNAFMEYAVEITNEIIDYKEELEKLWIKSENSYSKTVVKNYSYIEWKYLNHPLHPYSFIFVLNRQNIVGLGVYRFGRRGSSLVDYVGDRQAHIVKHLIVRNFIKQCKGSKILQCICSDKEFKTILKSFGFIQYKTRPRFYVHSSYKNDDKCHKDWFVMGGDSDCDLNSFDL